MGYHPSVTFVQSLVVSILVLFSLAMRDHIKCERELPFSSFKMKNCLDRILSKEVEGGGFSSSATFVDDTFLSCFKAHSSG